MGRMQREKGKRFERAIAAHLRELWPDADVRRASQAERAHNSDVFVAGPAKLERCWLELTDSRTPDPMAKLRQAELDVSISRRPDAWPVVIWHRTGERTTQVTTRLWVVDAIRETAHAYYMQIITMDINEWLGMLR